MIKEDIKQITNIEELQRLYIELNNEMERLEADYSQANDIIIEQQQKIERLNNNIKEAIKYIEDNTYKSNETEYMDLTGIRELLDILKGLDKE